MAGKGSNGSSCFGTGDVIGAVLGTFFSTVFVTATLGAALLYVICKPKLQQQNEFRLRQMNENIAKSDYQMTETRTVDEVTSANQAKRKRSTHVRNNLWNKSYSEDLSQIKDYHQMSRNSWMALLSRKRLSLDGRFPKASSLTLKTTRLSSEPRHGKGSRQSSLYGDQRFDLFEVPLKSNDPVGLGFNVFGNMMEGIYVTELLNRGPARDSGLIVPGDRIVSLTVNTEHMVLEDALTILSYASSYPIRLRIMREMKSRLGRPLDAEDNNEDNDPSETTATDGLGRLRQLRFRSQSMEELSMYHPRDMQTDTPLNTKGSWNTGPEMRKRRRPMLADEYFWSGTRGWRSEDDWFRQGEPPNNSLPNLRLLSSLALPRCAPSTIFSSCASSLGSTGSQNIKQQRTSNYLDLSKIPESDSYLSRFPASMSGSRSLIQMGISPGLSWLKARSLQTVSAEIQGRRPHEAKQDKSEKAGVGAFGGKSVSEGDALNETGCQRIWSTMSGNDVGIHGHLDSMKYPCSTPLSISNTDSRSAAAQDRVDSGAGEIKTSKKTENENEETNENSKDSENFAESANLGNAINISCLPQNLKKSIYSENYTRNNHVEYF